MICLLENLTVLLEGLRIAVESKSEEKLTKLLETIVSQAPESTAGMNLSHVLSR